jgi:hypothetical protein
MNILVPYEAEGERHNENKQIKRHEESLFTEVLSTSQGRLCSVTIIID